MCGGEYFPFSHAGLFYACFAPEELIFVVFELVKHKCFQLFSQLRIVCDALFGRVASLPQFGVVVAVP